MKKAIMMCFLTLCLLFCASAQARGDLRALLIGCDDFLTHEDTYPAAALNVQRVHTVLESDSRGYKSIISVPDGVGSIRELAACIRSAFEGVQDGDISILYICTHGLMDRVTLTPSLVLSDGSTEAGLTPILLRLMLDGLPGTCVLLLDACNSGAFIGKGFSSVELDNPFRGSYYKVLTSASASENSILWNDLTGSAGGSYFASELCDGLAGRGFDSNVDGVITLSELYQGLTESHGASTVQIYPQQDDTPIYCYDAGTTLTRERPLGDITVDDAVLESAADTLRFSYTLFRSARVEYQLVSYSGGQWHFESHVVIADDENGGAALSPGRKERELSLSSSLSSSSGYVLLQIIVREGRHAVIAGTRLITVQKSDTDPLLNIGCADVFSAYGGNELAVHISHAVPCTLTVSVRSEDGTLIRRLCVSASTRPLGDETQTVLWWDGRDAKGALVPAGIYQISAVASAGGQKYTAYSDPVTVFDASGPIAPYREEAENAGDSDQDNR